MVNFQATSIIYFTNMLFIDTNTYPNSIRNEGSHVDENISSSSSTIISLHDTLSGKFAGRKSDQRIENAAIQPMVQQDHSADKKSSSNHDSDISYSPVQTRIPTELNVTKSPPKIGVSSALSMVQTSSLNQNDFNDQTVARFAKTHGKLSKSLIFLHFH